MKTLTVRFEDRTYDELARIATAQGVSLSELARTNLVPLTRRELDDSGKRPGESPNTLSAVDRRQLSLLHRIMARLVVDDPDTEDGDPDYQLQRAQVLERGYVSEYSDEFISIEPELSRRETSFVMDVLDMFTQLEWSFAKLTDAERESLGERAEYHVQFGGFDLNDRLEGRLNGYARYLLADGKWEGMKKHFTEEHDRGNSHMPTYDKYTRMLDEFLPVWKLKLQAAHGGGYELSVDEIWRVIGAATHPSNR